MKTCSQCRKEYPDASRFCTECGGPLTEETSTALPSSTGISLGDKNVISGEIIGHKEDIRVAGNANIFKNEDQTREVKTCAFCGKPKIIMEGVFCRRCGSFVCDEHYDKDSGQCVKCKRGTSSEAEQQYMTLLQEVMADNRIDAQERQRLDETRKRLNLTEERTRELENNYKSLLSAQIDTLGRRELRRLDIARQALMDDFHVDDALSVLAPLYERFRDNPDVRGLYLLAMIEREPEKALLLVQGMRFDDLDKSLAHIELLVRRGDLDQAADVIRQVRRSFGEEHPVLLARDAELSIEEYRLTKRTAMLDDARDCIEQFPPEISDPYVLVVKAYLEYTAGNGDALDNLAEVLKAKKLPSFYLLRLRNRIGLAPKRTGSDKTKSGTKTTGSEKPKNGNPYSLNSTKADLNISDTSSTKESNENTDDIEKTCDTAMDLSWEHGKTSNASEGDIRNAFDDVESTSGFVILAKASCDEEYIQTAAEGNDKYILEFREGNAKLHFQCVWKTNRKETEAIFIKYLNCDVTWKPALQWYKIDYDEGGEQNVKTPVEINEIGENCRDGAGVTQDDLLAVKYFREAANLGNRDAQCNLGWMNANGRGVPENKTEAVKWYRKAAEQGYVCAQFRLGYTYDFGEGVTVDKTEAARWYRSAAEQGDANAQWNLGLAYLHGEGVEEDKIEAERWFVKAAEQGDAEYEFQLGFNYLVGLDVAEDDVKAVKWLRKAAEQGEMNAQASLAKCYEDGTGVAEDHEEATKWYQMAAEQGHEEAKNKLTMQGKDIATLAHELSQMENQLGINSRDGVNGAVIDDTQAVAYFRKAAEAGNADAQINLGWMYGNGRGVARDDSEAVKWYKMAADQGHALGQCNMGIMCEQGLGTRRDMNEAANWFKLATEQGSAMAHTRKLLGELPLQIELHRKKALGSESSCSIMYPTILEADILASVNRLGFRVTGTPGRALLVKDRVNPVNNEVVLYLSGMRVEGQKERFRDIVITLDVPGMQFDTLPDESNLRFFIERWAVNYGYPTANNHVPRRLKLKHIAS